MSGGTIGWYLSLAAPPGTPPRFVFAPVWTALYVLIGVAGWLVWRRVGAAAILRRPLRLWGWQLLLNALWTPVFFGLRSPAAALVVMLGLLVLVWLTLRAFGRVNLMAAGLFAPYALWVTYAAYLNLGFWWMNGF
jgi:benzodiazapine receptor